jgi:HAD superfamily hydrolase (TIGR01549 family)
MIQAAIFDIDGTLIDSVDLHAKAWQEALEHFGHKIPYEEVRYQIGKGGDQLMPVFLSKEELEEIGEELEEYRGKLYKSKYLSKVRAFPKVRELFQKIKSYDIRITLASSAKEDEVEIYKRITNIGDLIESSTSADDAERSKPHPDIFAASLDQLNNIRPEDALVLGDTPYDAEAAGKLNIRTIGLLCGGFPEGDLRAAGCIEIYRDPADLLARLEESAFFSSKHAAFSSSS